jgi:hypothetical protein
MHLISQVWFAAKVARRQLQQRTWVLLGVRFTGPTSTKQQNFRLQFRSKKTVMEVWRLA